VPGPDVIIDDEDGSQQVVSVNIGDPTWKISISKVDVEEPWWIDFGIAVADTTVSIAIPFIAPFVALVGIGLMLEVDSLITDAQNKVYDNIQNVLYTKSGW